MANNEYCQLVNILIPKYVKGQCTKAEGAILGEHCAECPECREKLVRAFNVSPTISGEVLFLSRPKNLKLYQKSGSKEIKQEANTDRDYVIDWKDSVLKSRMQEITGIYTRDIKYSDVKNIKGLKLSSYDRSKKISNISALSNLTNLTSLTLGSNQISDISSLSSLTNLRKLSLWGNQLSDISALSNLTNLTTLYLEANEISDISALSSLKKLNWLNLTKNRITDYSPIEHLNIQHMFPEYVKGQRTYPTVGKTKNKKRSQKNRIDDIIFNFGEALGIVEADKNEQS